MNKYEYCLQHVDNMIVIAAPSCCGKSVFIQTLKRSGKPSPEYDLDIDDLNSWTFANAHQVSQIREEHVQQMVLHYAIPSLSLTSGQLGDISDDPKLLALSLAKKVSFLTLYAAPRTLVHRVGLRKRSNRKMLLRNPQKYYRESKRLKQLEELYRRPDKLSHIYDKWLMYCQSYQAKTHWLISVESDPLWTPVSDWPIIARNFYARY